MNGKGVNGRRETWRLLWGRRRTWGQYIKSRVGREQFQRPWTPTCLVRSQRGGTRRGRGGGPKGTNCPRSGYQQGGIEERGRQGSSDRGVPRARSKDNQLKTARDIPGLALRGWWGTLGTSMGMSAPSRLLGPVVFSGCGCWRASLPSPVLAAVCNYC